MNVIFQLLELLYFNLFEFFGQTLISYISIIPSLFILTLIYIIIYKIFKNGNNF